MTDRRAVVGIIERAFADVPHPGDAYLVNSDEGCEPGEIAAAFAGHHDWRTVEPRVLDENSALSFFSEGAFRFYLPAYMRADLREQLLREDPVFHLTGSFIDRSIEIPSNGETFVRQIGKSAFINPIRYGAITWHDYARHRLAVFPREEARAIVAYLEARRDGDDVGFDREAIDAALETFWRDRAENAPTAARIVDHLAEERRYLSTLE